MGPEFQASLPTCLADGKQSGLPSPDEESLKEQLLWKPLDKKEESGDLPGQGKQHTKISSAQYSDCTFKFCGIQGFFKDAKMSGLKPQQVDISEQNNQVSLK